MHLFLYTTAAVAIGGVEGAVVAVGASACAFASIAVGAGEASVDGYFLHLAVENAAGVAAVVVVVESLSCTHFLCRLPLIFVPLLDFFNFWRNICKKSL